ncbi:PREDICTED: alpha-2A adrenergic receptor [Polistes dominula]|uniref:Alpha-2A adrenergic receptor n=1 Tax=Polistes dominula TaxID=743375 RepID=A0ABM1HZ90_POLDO|nr:PREDICTED: alpha-2A adrenergic receptor [Polistes dominula]
MIPPVFGNIMSNEDAVSSATASTRSIFEENMTWYSSTTVPGTTTSSFSTINVDNVEEEDRTEINLTSLTDFAVGWTSDWNNDTTETTIEDNNNNSSSSNSSRRRIGGKIVSSEENGTLNDPIERIGEQPRGGGEGGGGGGGGGGRENPLGCGCDIEDSSFISSISNRSTFEIFTGGSSLGVDLLFGITSDTMEEDFADSYSNDSIFNGSMQYPFNNNNNNNDSNNETLIVYGDSMYPSGYTLPHIILASIIATLLMIIIVVGNMLVIIAIATEKALKNIQNWFIASLAVADFFLGLIIMPFSLANEIMGYWIFGYWWCDIYSAMDVLLCTASIMNLCLISLDRFWSITQAVDYLKKRTPARAALMIALVWLLSALVCIPPLLGWKRPSPEEDYPKCKLSEDIGYVLYSALGSFYIPSCIMVFVYIRIYFAAKARARRGIRKPPRPRPIAVPPESPDIRQTSFTQSTTALDSRRTGPGGAGGSSGTLMENVATIENQPVQIPIVTCDYASDVSTSEADPAGGNSIPMEEKDTLKVTIPVPVQKTNLKASLSVNGDGQSSQAVVARCRAPSVGIDTDMVSEFDPSSSDSGVVSRCAVVKPLKLRLCQPIFGRKATGKVKREHADTSKQQGKEEIMIDAKSSKPRDPEREKKRIARKKEKRATLILGFIMGSFIACWLPFFLLYIVKPLFPNLNIPTQAFVIAFWLGYMNSALNPFIYTVFNKDFRRAFRRILFK